MPTDNRATAERIALTDADIEQLWNDSRGVLKEYVSYPWGPFEKVMLGKVVRAAFARGMAHRDRTAEREAASKALGYIYGQLAARPVVDKDVALAVVLHAVQSKEGYLAAEFDAGERVTLSDGSVVIRSGYIIRRENATQPGAEGTNIASWHLLIHRTDTGADFDAVKRLAEQRGAER